MWSALKWLVSPKKEEKKNQDNTEDSSEELSSEEPKESEENNEGEDEEKESKENEEISQEKGDKEELKIENHEEEPKMESPKEEPKMENPKEEPKIENPEEEPKMENLCIEQNDKGLREDPEISIKKISSPEIQEGFFKKLFKSEELEKIHKLIEIKQIEFYEKNFNKTQTETELDSILLLLEQNLLKIKLTLSEQDRNLLEEWKEEIEERFEEMKSNFKKNNEVTEIDLRKIIALIKWGKSEKDSSIGKELVLFIGITRAGKSTTISYLSGCEMFTKTITVTEEVDDEDEEIERDVIESKGGLEIGHGIESCTK